MGLKKFSFMKKNEVDSNKGSVHIDHHYITVEDFHELREDTEALLEYVDGTVYMSPSTKHQRISGR